jgi:hypothetical protein
MLVAGAIRNSDSMPQLRRFSKRGTRFDASSGHVRIVVGRVALGQVFSEYFGFSLHILLHNH